MKEILYRWITGYMARSGLILYLDMGGDAPPPADTSAMAAATKESAEVMAALGREQLAESKRQYDINRATAEPVVATQLALMNQTKAQGDDYFNYMKATGRPIEQKMAAEAMTAGSDQAQEEAAGRAVADVRRGRTSAINSAIRAGLRFGMSSKRIGSGVAADALSAGSAEAAAANAGRTQEKATGWAKKLDVAGLMRGLPGASQGAYSVALNSGNSAVDNTMKPGGALLAGNLGGASLIGQGQQFNMQGNQAILGANQQAYNSQMQANSASSAGLGNLIGMGMKFGLNHAFPGAGAVAGGAV